MIIDAHSHLLASWTPRASLRNHPDQVEEFDLEAFDSTAAQLGVATVVTLAQEMTRFHDKWLGSNPLSAAFARLRPQTVIGMGGAEPLDKRDILNSERLEELRTSLRDGSLRGLLLTPPYGHYYANDPRCYPFYSLAEESGVPVYLHHSAQLGDTHLAPLKFARPWLLDEVAADFPKLTMLVEHMGWPWSQELFALMAHCPNVWTDISMIFRRPTLLAWNLTMAREYGLLDRVVWGTDYVGDSVEKWATVVRRDTAWLHNDLNPLLKQCGWPQVTDGELTGILYDNARRLLAPIAPTA